MHLGSAWVAVIWRLIWAGGAASEWLSHMTGKLMLTAPGRPQFPSIWASPQGCLSILTTWRPASPGTSDPRRKWQCLLWLSLGNNPLSLPWYFLGPMSPPWFSEGGDYTRAWIPGMEDHREPSCNAKATIKQDAILSNRENVRKGNSFRILPFQHHRISDRGFISFSVNWWRSTEYRLHSHYITHIVCLTSMFNM